MPHAREVRLGLVLYGGVSLAVYENGIAQEIYRAVRCQGFYELIAELIDSDIVVDIISGTSAGGVNGVMLAYALANKKEFAPSAQLWRDQGDILKLMRSQGDENDSSVLDSAYYQEKLRECFEKNLVDSLEAFQIGELDLFVTSTDANGALSTVYDDLGHALDIKNHRALFKLSYRGARKNDLGAAPKDLATLCRMTSCFPAAFEPVKIEIGDSEFFRWGKLRDPAVFLDGGILNNKPFTSTIEAIATRTATREVERVLIYVEPKPEQFVPPAGTPPSPAMVQAAIGSLISIPGYQSIAGDLDAIQAHNDRAGRVAAILEALPAAPKTTADCLAKAGVTLEEDDACNPEIYYTARYIQIRDAAVAAVLDDALGRGYFPPKAAASQPSLGANQAQKITQLDARRSGRILVESFNAWPGDGLETLRRFDIFFRMRRAAHLSRTLMSLVKSGTPVPAAVWETVNHHFKLYEILKWAMVRRLQVRDFNWQNLSGDYPDLDTQPEEEQERLLSRIAENVWGQVAGQMEDLLGCGLEVPISPEASARESFYKTIRAIAEGPGGGPKTGSLLESIDNRLKQSLTSADPSAQSIFHLLRDEFCRFVEVDRHLFLVQIGSDFESTDMIRVVRFSPLDAQRCLSRGAVESKVRGSTLGAFGGFFKKSWRANDIMMGRLDGACLLTECLLSKERLALMAQKRTVSPALVQRSFPQLDDAGVARLVEQIDAYLADPTGAVADRWEALVNAIVCAAHDAIHQEEYPMVIACAIEQEYDWGVFRLNKNPPPPPLALPIIYNREELFWYRAKSKVDQVLVQVAAEYVAKGRTPPFIVTPFPPGLLQAAPFLEEIPDAVLQELGALATIRLGKGLLGSVSNNRKREQLANSHFYSIPFNWVAPAAYRFGRIRRTQPDTVVILNTALVVFCFTVMALAIVLPLVGIKIDVGHRIAMFMLGMVLFLGWCLWVKRTT